jgi:hypothetical protein
VVGLWAVLAFTACQRCGEPPPEIPVDEALASPSAPATLPAALATVVSQRGKVEVQRNRGEWTPVKLGDRLDTTDAIRTSEEGEVDIAVNEVKLRIHERSQFTVKNLSDSVIRGRLTGRMESQVVKGKGQVEVEAEGSDAVVRTDGGHFSMIASGRGVVAVANISGEVNVSAKGKSVSIAPGDVSHVRTNKAPDKPSRALRSVLLAVEWPAAKITNRTTVSLSGRVEVGSRVLIAGRVVDADDNGVFRTQVELRSGKQQLAVVATDVLGRKRLLAKTLTHDAKAPHVKLKGKLWQ